MKEKGATAPTIAPFHVIIAYPSFLQPYCLSRQLTIIGADIVLSAYSPSPFRCGVYALGCRSGLYCRAAKSDSFTQYIYISRLVLG